MMTKLKWAGLFIAFLLGGCMSMPLSTMYKMSQFSPLDIKPDELKVAIRTNEAVTVQSGAVTVDMAYTTEGNNDLPPLNRAHKFFVQASQDDNGKVAPILLDGIEDKEQLTILTLSDYDARLMTETLEIVRRYKAADIKGTGSFSLTTNNSCFGDLSQFESLEVDVFIQTDNNDGYMLFLEDVDIIEQAADNDIQLAPSNKCKAE